MTQYDRLRANMNEIKKEYNEELTTYRTTDRQIENIHTERRNDRTTHDRQKTMGDQTKDRHTKLKN